MVAAEDKYTHRQDLWTASRHAENRGDFRGALEIHKRILMDEEASYAASLRAGWLYYKLGSFEESLRYYERACVLSDDAWPLYGIMNCLTALGETDTLARVAECLYETSCCAVAV